MWWEQLGPDDARALMSADNEPAESAARVNTLRASVDGMSVVCSVDSTRWPVSPAASAILIVSGSRISPTTITSGA